MGGYTGGHQGGIGWVCRGGIYAGGAENGGRVMGGVLECGKIGGSRRGN